MIITSMKATFSIEFNIEQVENTKFTERRKAKFLQEKMKNADLYKPVLKKIMTTYE